MPVSALVLTRSIRTQQKAALRVARSCLLRAAYKVHYRRAGEADWQYAGTVEVGAQLQVLNLPELPTGEYEVEISTLGFAWKPHLSRTHTRFRVAVSGAELALPAVTDLQAVIEGNYIVLSWLWNLQLGTHDPSEFAVWISQTATVDTLAPPVLSVPADGNRRHYARILAFLPFAGVAARYGGPIGPISAVILPQPSDALPSPEGQHAIPFDPTFTPE